MPGRESGIGTNRGRVVNAVTAVAREEGGAADAIIPRRSLPRGPLIKSGPVNWGGRRLRARRRIPFRGGTVDGHWSRRRARSSGIFLFRFSLPFLSFSFFVLFCLFPLFYFPARIARTTTIYIYILVYERERTKVLFFFSSFRISFRVSSGAGYVY